MHVYVGVTDDQKHRAYLTRDGRDIEWIGPSFDHPRQAIDYAKTIRDEQFDTPELVDYNPSESDDDDGGPAAIRDLPPEESSGLTPGVGNDLSGSSDEAVSSPALDSPSSPLNSEGDRDD